MRIVWLHGLEGSPFGYKATELRRRGWDLLAPDGRGLPLKARIEGATRTLDRHDDVVLIGSSYGGLAAAWFGSQRPLEGLLLLAPALHHSETPVVDAGQLRILPDTPTRVIHGTGDTIVPIEVSRALASRCPHVALTEVDDTHALSASIDLMDAALRELTGCFASYDHVHARQTDDGVVLDTDKGSFRLTRDWSLSCQTYPLIGGVGVNPLILTLTDPDGTEHTLVHGSVDDDQYPDHSTAETLTLEGFVDAVNAELQRA